MQPLQAHAAWKPELLSPVDPSGNARIQALRAEGGTVHVVDEYRRQLLELYAIEHPDQALGAGFKRTAESHIAAFEKERPLEKEGMWAYFPWMRTLVHILADDEFQKVRMARNRNLITEREQQEFYGKTVGIAGLSIGNSVALAIALQGGARRMKLADHDTLELSNLNRIRSGVPSLGLPKTELTARQIYELNPYAELELFSEGLTDENLSRFFSGLDIVVDEIDNLSMKASIREEAKRCRVPVVMAVDNGEDSIVDVERYDRTPGLPLFHGRLGAVNADTLASLTKTETGSMIVRHIGPENLAPRARESFSEMGKTLVSWPQLGGAALLNGSVVSYVVRKIAIDEPVINDRAIVSLDKELGRAGNQMSGHKKTSKLRTILGL